MKNMKLINITGNKYTTKKIFSSVHRDQRGFNVLGFLAFVAVVVVLALLFIPNVNLFLGIDKKISAANVEALNVRAAATAYEINHNGKYPTDSDVLWSEGAGPGDYVGQPRAYYSFDIGTGRIIDATMNTEGHIPANPWTGIKWDFDSGSWVKQ
jgi:competence protein ComGC